MMTEEMKKHLMDEVSEELNGVHEYIDISADMDYQGKPYCAEGFKRISYDEYTHAKFICEVLESEGVEIPEDIKMGLHKASMMFPHSYA